MKTVLFDAYGTLFDLEPALTPAANRLGDRAPAVFERWRTLQLEYAWLSALRGNRIDFDECTKSAFLDALAAEGVQDAPLVDALLNAFRSVPAYPDAADCLQRLQDAAWRTAILSNGEDASLATMVDASSIRSRLDAVLSVARSGAYKPAPAAYEVGAAFAGGEPEETVFVSSNWWDVIGARRFGFRAALIVRPGKFWPASAPRPELTVHSLEELSRALA